VRNGRVAVLWGAAVIVALLFVAIRAQPDFFDLRVYWNAMRWWSDGNPLYAYAQSDHAQRSLGFTYPPAGAYLLRPLAWLSLSQAEAAAVLVTLACVGASSWWLADAVARRHGWSRPALAVVVFALTLALGPVWFGLRYGQINPVLWALIVLDLAVLGPRRSSSFGVGIGLATAIKLVPGIFIAYLFVSGRRRATVVASATAVAVTLLAHAGAPADSTAFWTDALWRGDGLGDVAFFTNQSLNGLLARTWLPNEAPRWLWALLCLPVLGFGLWRARRAALAGDELTGMALAGITGSLVSPVTWLHHIFWFAPALLALADSAADPAAPRIVHSGLRDRRPMVVVGVVVFGLIAEINTIAHPGGLLGFTFGNIVVWLMLALLVITPIDPARTAVRSRTPALAAV
jgi:alpha-1,2-mannosyltransferase